MRMLLFERRAPGLFRAWSFYASNLARICAILRLPAFRLIGFGKFNMACFVFCFSPGIRCAFSRFCGDFEKYPIDSEKFEAG